MESKEVVPFDRDKVYYVFGCVSLYLRLFVRVDVENYNEGGYLVFVTLSCLVPRVSFRY